LAGHDLIVIGGSAGAIDALLAIVRKLPSDLPAAICVVIHTSPAGPHLLPEVLDRETPLPVRSPRTGEAIETGTIYVAPPDWHLLIEPGRLRLSHGPKENRSRPAVDPLFRSAAWYYAARVVGVVLSGALDDGTAGLWTIKDRGGISVVQDPEDSLVSSMPSSARTNVSIDYELPALAIGPLLAKLAELPADAPTEATPPSGDSSDLEREIAVAALDDDVHRQSSRYGVPSRFACPDCGGVLWRTRSVEGPLSLRCEVGHAYSAAALAEEQADSTERALWAGVRAMEDQAELARIRGIRARGRGQEIVARRYGVQAEAALEHAGALRAILRLNGRSGIRPNDLMDLPDSRREEPPTNDEANDMQAR
jgi:two-component system chemotaxis response regulator CheB